MSHGDGSKPPRNRKERRRQQRQNPTSTTTGDDPSSLPFKLAQPDRDAPAPTGKSLFQLADEREHLLSQGKPFAKPGPPPSTQRGKKSANVGGDAAVSEEKESEQGKGNELEHKKEEVDEPIGHFASSVFFTITLLMLHFTLDVLVHHQYRQEIGWGMILWRIGMASPVLLGLVYALHGEASTPTLALATQFFFFAVSTLSGCYLVRAANEEAYFAVMKRAPPLGTLWVWSVIELKLEYALPSLMMVGAYLWYGEYSMI
ncbi:MAG: hypothetical protein M1837_003315 [Sclerophora amabilis]|nr:MAG: hypothetical protein M1837_003315 [Sclerophora amabilis]